MREEFDMSKYVFVGAMLLTVVTIALMLVFTIGTHPAKTQADADLIAGGQEASGWRASLPTLCISSTAHAVQDVVGTPSHIVDGGATHHGQYVC
jgi:hypothetical protein